MIRSFTSHLISDRRKNRSELDDLEPLGPRSRVHLQRTIDRIYQVEELGSTAVAKISIRPDPLDRTSTDQPWEA